MLWSAPVNFLMRSASQIRIFGNRGKPKTGSYNRNGLYTWLTLTKYHRLSCNNCNWVNGLNRIWHALDEGNGPVIFLQICWNQPLSRVALIERRFNVPSNFDSLMGIHACGHLWNPPFLGRWELVFSSTSSHRFIRALVLLTTPDFPTSVI